MVCRVFPVRPPGPLEFNGGRELMMTTIRKPEERNDRSPQAEDPCSCKEVNGPSFDPDNVYGLEQKPQDMIDEAIMESFPCSDPPSFTNCHV
jgi:hypothetical protein